MKAVAVRLAATALAVSGCGALSIGGDDLTVTMHNELDHPVILEITESATGPGRPPRIAPPITIAANYDGPVTFSSPQADWSLWIAGQDGFFASSDLHGWSQQLESGELSTFRLVIQAANGEMAAETAP
jgi:hypothetical protein